MSTTQQTAVDDLAAWQAKVDGLRKKKTPDVPVTIHDLDAERDLEDARAALVMARGQARRALRGDGDTVDDAAVEQHPDVQAKQQELQDAEQAAEDAAVTFNFRKLPPDVYDQMQFQHPPTDAQAAKDMVYNPDTFIPALISACSVMPIAPEQVRSLMQPDPETGNVALNQGDVGVLFAACRGVNEKSRVSLGKGSRLTRN